VYKAGTVDSNMSGPKRRVEACSPYLQNILDTVELLDAKNSTCEAQYLDLRRSIKERDLFDLCLETILVRDEVDGVLTKHKESRDGRFFGGLFDGLFGDDDNGILGGGGGGEKGAGNALEMNLNAVNTAFSSRAYCEPREFCRSCSRTGVCCERFCERMWYDSSLEDYSCSSDYCGKHSTSSNCSKCDHCNCRHRYGNY